MIGAGPGDPGLITVKGLNLLKKADVVIYDRLVSPQLVKQCKSSTRRIYVGRRPGEHAISEDDIVKMMIEEAHKGKHVVRLKGGDPMLFGRGGEEAELLRQAGIEFRIVPGITSAIAVPAYAGIPITHRKCASSVAIITGHDYFAKHELVNWKKLATSVDTMIILMGMARLEEIVRELLLGGLPRNVKVAIVEWGTTSRQRTVTGTLSNIASRSKAHKLEPPAVIVIGEVVKYQRRLAWFRPKRETNRIT